jgi:hydrogenase-1 operon protein HyaF
MSGLTHSDDLKVVPGEFLTHNVQPLLHELRHAVGRLLDEGEATVIDLRSIPLAPGEEDRLLGELGRGEVAAQLSALGPSEIVESRFPGVWIVTHYNTDSEVIGRFIEVCDMPGLLKAQQDDIRDGLAALEARLAGTRDT